MTARVSAVAVGNFAVAFVLGPAFCFRIVSATAIRIFRRSLWFVYSSYRWFNASGQVSFANGANSSGGLFLVFRTPGLQALHCQFQHDVRAVR